MYTLLLLAYKVWVLQHVQNIDVREKLARCNQETTYPVVSFLMRGMSC